MELPIELRAAIETEAACVPQSQLRLMADSLSRRYREDARDGHSMLSRSADAIAYAAARLTASAALTALSANRPCSVWAVGLCRAVRHSLTSM